MFVDLDWPLNASSPLSASAELLVLRQWTMSPSLAYITGKCSKWPHSVSCRSTWFRNGRAAGKCKGIAPLSESSPQTLSGMACVLKGSHSFTTRSSAIGMSHTCLCLPSYSWYTFTDPGGMEGWVGLGGWLRSETVYLCPKAVIHPTTNWAQCGATTLIETNTLPLY